LPAWGAECTKSTTRRVERPFDPDSKAVADSDLKKFAKTLRESAQYSPEFQLELLGVGSDALPDPILDLGCGQDARLVHWLREQGRDAFGIDLRAEDCTNYIMQADWLSFPLQPDYWATIISHQGFSNHFLNHHLRRNGHPERYARRYLAILRALKPGGSFLYAPGLPFFEPLLPSDVFHVQRRPVHGLEASGVQQAVLERVGADVLYATRVLKLLGA
jgi:SAM-dependent methyltransferase